MKADGPAVRILWSIDCREACVTAAVRTKNKHSVLLTVLDYFKLFKWAKYILSHIFFLLLVLYSPEIFFNDLNSINGGLACLTKPVIRSIFETDTKKILLDNNYTFQLDLTDQ